MTSRPLTAAPDSFDVLRRLSRQKLRVLKWLAITVPALAIYVAETIRHELMGSGHEATSSWTGNALVGLIALACSFVFAQIIFRRVEAIQAELERRHQHLQVIHAVAVTTGAPNLGVPRIVEQALEVIRPLFPDDQVLWQMGPAGSTESPSERVIAVPLQTHNGSVGALRIVRPSGVWRTEERQLLALIGDTLSLALENAELHEALKLAAVSEERNRLAREMHDGVAQFLVYAQLQLGMLSALIRDGETERARGEAERLLTATERANEDIRANIAGLRILADVDTELSCRLQAFVDEFEDQTNVHTTLTIDGDIDAIPTDCKVQLMCILQEGLTNVRKHAAARSAQITLSTNDRSAWLSVSDDGQGLSEQAAARSQRQRCFGIEMMRERAASVGGTVEITSTPGAGTRVDVWIPLECKAGYEDA